MSGFFSSPSEIIGDLTVVDGNIILSGGFFVYSNGVPVSATYIDNEIPSEAVDGFNLVFTIDNLPLDDSLHVYVNGQLVYGSGTDYTLAFPTVTFVEAPTGKVSFSYRM